MLGGAYYFLDLTALGRQEDWEEPKGVPHTAGAAIPDFSTEARAPVRPAPLRISGGTTIGRGRDLNKWCS